MQLEMLAKDAQSGEKNCPSVHDDLDGTEVLLGRPDRRQLTRGERSPREGVVRIKRDVVIEAVQRYLAR